MDKPVGARAEVAAGQESTSRGGADERAVSAQKVRKFGVAQDNLTNLVLAELLHQIA